jgi:hypothetical protein
MCLCIDACRGADESRQGCQNESSGGHCQGAPMKQGHEEERQAEDHKFHDPR